MNFRRIRFLLWAIVVVVGLMVFRLERSPFFFSDSSISSHTRPVPHILHLEQRDRPDPPDPEEGLSIDRQRLMNHLTALAIERYTPAGRARTRRYIVNALQAVGWVPQEQSFTHTVAEKTVTGINVIAAKPGTDPTAGEILLGAHYDTVEGTPGADDNGSGVAVLLEAARLFGDRSFPRSLKLVFFDLEEEGLLGSQAFVEDQSQTRFLNGTVILEMVGYGCNEPGCQRYPQGLPVTPDSTVGNFLAVVGDMRHGGLIDAFQPENHDSSLPIFTLQVPTLGPLTPDLLRSDHVPFWRHGLGAVMVTDTANFRNPHYHQPSDTPQSLNEEFFNGSAEVVVRAIAHLLTPP